MLIIISVENNDSLKRRYICVYCCVQLSSTKSADQKSTLLHFLVEIVERKHPELVGFTDELIHVEQASKG